MYRSVLPVLADAGLRAIAPDLIGFGRSEKPADLALLAAYDAPFPDETHKTAVREMPGLVPTTPNDPASEANRMAWQTLSVWDKPFLVAFSDADPITSGMAPILTKTVPCARTVTIEGAGHFLQEDAGPRLAEEIARFVTGPCG